MNGENMPLAYDIAAVAAVILYLLIWRIARSNRPTRPANTDTARWTPNDWPQCDWQACRFPGTNHIEWVRSDAPGYLCPGHRDEAVTKDLARDAWDDAS